MNLFWTIVSVLLFAGLVFLVISLAIMATWMDVMEGEK